MNHRSTPLHPWLAPYSAPPVSRCELFRTPDQALILRPKAARNPSGPVPAQIYRPLYRPLQTDEVTRFHLPFTASTDIAVLVIANIRARGIRNFTKLTFVFVPFHGSPPINSISSALFRHLECSSVIVSVWPLKKSRPSLNIRIIMLFTTSSISLAFGKPVTFSPSSSSAHTNSNAGGLMYSRAPI